MPVNSLDEEIRPPAAFSVVNVCTVTSCGGRNFASFPKKGPIRLPFRMRPVALAVAGVVFALMFLWFVTALVFRRRFQFGLPSLLVLVLAVGKQKEAATALANARC
jgi:hypothetical protein